MTVRVLVVEDSLTLRRYLCDALTADASVEVVGEATDGKEAIELCQRLRPDVVTMDMMLPVMSGLSATEYIMAHCPTPILIVSASTNRGELFRTYDALAAGAVDVLEKPLGDEPGAAWRARLVETVKLVSRIRVITHPRGRLGALAREPAAPLVGPPASGPGRFKVVGLGASTGGPGAVLDVLRELPPSFSLPVLLVLHIAEPFGTAFAEWLDGQIGRPVRLARDGDRLLARTGEVVMAPPDFHLTVADGRIRLTTDAERHSCRPSADVLFESMARDCGPAAVGCLMTGMGRDGAAGLLELRRAGGITIAQDEATSVVYGMPREAVLLGAAAHVLPLGQIGPTLVSFVHRTGHRA